MKTRLPFAIAMLGCLWTSEARLGACECVSPVSPCVAFEDTPVVFVGQALEIAVVEPPPKGESPFPPISRRVSFKVTEVLRGDIDDAVVVYTGSGGGDCGFTFAKAKTYLVYAHRSKTGQLTTGICARTREATQGAQGEIKELRSLAQEPRKCRQS